MKPDHKHTPKRPFATVCFNVPPMINCRKCDDLIPEYVDGTLSTPQKLSFHLHLLFCKDCRAYLRKYQSVVSLVQSQRDVASPENASPDMSDDLFKNIVNARVSGSAGTIS